MAEVLKFDEETSRLVESGYTRPEMIRRRARALELVTPRWGEAILDIGCGPGFLCNEMAGGVGNAGKILGVDVSESMLDLARVRCAGVPWVGLELADPCLPRTLAPKLRDAGFALREVEVFNLTNVEPDANTYTFSLIFGVTKFATERELVSREEMQAWADDLLALAAAGEYFFSLNQYFFVADKR